VKDLAAVAKDLAAVLERGALAIVELVCASFDGGQALALASVSVGVGSSSHFLRPWGDQRVPRLGGLLRAHPLVGGLLALGLALGLARAMRRPCARIAAAPASATPPVPQPAPLPRETAAVAVPPMR